MSVLAEIGILLFQTVISFALLLFIMRLILQLAKADFYNPISQFIVKFTNPPLLPMRRVVPAIAGVDTSSLILILLVQALGICGTLLLYGYSMPPIINLLIWSVIGATAFVVSFYLYAVLANIVLSWIAPGTNHPAAALLHQLVEPVMNPFRKLLPPMGGLDLSPILVFLSIQVLQVLLRHTAGNTGLHAALVFGI